ncbi:MAG: ferritin-like domain-containing protein [Candidatus Eremiobacteraeota bacterium]|nr:ferritin-like domain-containing protein [Candidatus Eremiobacteraeota bacterium]
MSDLGTTQDSAIRYDSSAQGGTGESERHSIQTYVSDMLALERHIAQPLQRQLDMQDTKKFPGALAAITSLKGLTDSHVTALEQCLEQLGGHAASPVKSAWSSLLGAGAAAIDSVRKTKVSKNLRDDYTALSLATISYTMLLATATGLGDSATADLAKRHIADYAQVVMTINRVIPEVVLTELQIDGENVQVGAGELIRKQTNEIWKTQSADVT